MKNLGHNRMLKLVSYACAFAAIVLLSSCGAEKDQEIPVVTDLNRVTLYAPAITKVFGDDFGGFSAMGPEAYTEKLQSGQLLASDSVQGRAVLSSWTEATGGSTGAEITRKKRPNFAGVSVGFPKAQLGKPFIFGGVFTKMSDKNSEDLGGLKLTSFPAMLVKTILKQDTHGNSALGLLPCPKGCAAASGTQTAIDIPVLAIQEASGQLILDIASLGTQLSLYGVLFNDNQEAEAEQFGMVDKTSRATSADFSENTLVFDVETELAGSATANTPAPATSATITARWYLRPEAVAHPNFKARSPMAGVGFFLTERGRAPTAKAKVTRWATKSEGGAPVHYFVKNVPAQWKPAFANVFANWNKELKKIVGDLELTYEFVDASDARSNLIETGDIRYNVIEWDLNNRAPYGGLGPSIAHPITGETLAAHILIQGPEVISLYSTWFGAVSRAHDLRRDGDAVAAEQLLIDTKRELEGRFSELRPASEQRKLSLTMVDTGISFTIPSQLPEYQDHKPIEFFNTPAGMTFASYMPGYFTDMVEHEMGHNLGLRHNFRGNLGGAATPVADNVSRSVMEYLPTLYRYLDGIGEYDRMAIAFAYTGTQPTHLDWFCTDEDEAQAGDTGKSPECTKNDATNDPFNFLRSSLKRMIDLTVNRGSKAAPTWKVADFKQALTQYPTGLANYITLAASSSPAKWTNWRANTTEVRPTEATAVQAYVGDEIKKILCDASLATEISGKGTAADVAATKANLKSVRQAIAKVLSDRKVPNAEALTCASN